MEQKMKRNNDQNWNRTKTLFEDILYTIVGIILICIFTPQIIGWIFYKETSPIYLYIFYPLADAITIYGLIYFGRRIFRTLRVTIR